MSHGHASADGIRRKGVHVHAKTGPYGLARGRKASRVMSLGIGFVHGGPSLGKRARGLLGRFARKKKRPVGLA